MNKQMAKRFGNFIGKFISYDYKAIARGYNEYMQIKLELMLEIL